jgi:serine/threonine protein kinase/TolB-like protein/tetratricopeptide (TPR) repeat protein
VTPERWQEVKRALSDVLALPPAAREEYVRALRAQSADLAREVESLLPHDTDATFLDQPAIAIAALGAGAAFGPYLIESALGEGGMGMVYLARDTSLERPVAIKFLSRALEGNEDARRRFLREARAAAALDHPYICKIYQTGEQDGRPFIAMEYVRGETLRQRLDAGTLSLKDAAWITLEVVEALETAHAAQIVHRDLKPSNIMLTADGHVKVLDFGLAKRVDTGPEYADTGSAITDTGTVQGTVAYMSPEQVRGESVDLRSDLFSVGVVLYECLAGRNPFLARSALETASQILHYAPPGPSTVRAEIPQALDRLVQRLLVKSVAERYASAADLRADLVRVRDGVDRGLPPVDAMPVPALRRAFSRRAAIGSIAASLAVAASGTWWWKARAGRQKSVVVLPFTKGDDNAPDHLAIGIPIEVTRRLANAGISVRPWETAMRFRDDIDTKKIAGALGVTSVLTGSLQTVTDRLFVNVSLNDGATGDVTWTKEQEFGLPDLFDVQTTIAQGIADALGYELTGDAAATLARAESSSTDAWDFYLQGARYLYAEGGKEALGAALTYFEKALALDSDLVAAHVGIGAVRLESHWNGWGGGENNLTLAGKSFAEASKRDNKDMRAWRGLMLIEFYKGNGDAALVLGQKAAQAGGPEIETLLARAEAFMNNGPADLAVPLLNRVLELDPGNEAAAWGRIIALHQSDQWTDLAIAAVDYRKRFGEDAFVTVLHAGALTQQNDVKNASALLEPLMDRLMAPAVTNVTAYEYVALIGGVAIAERTGRAARAHQLGQRGLDLTLEGLQSDPDNIGLNLYAATFRGFAGDAAFSGEAERMVKDIKSARVNPFALLFLATAYAHRGETDSALDLLRYGLKGGRLVGRGWMSSMRLWTPALKDAPGFKTLLDEYTSEEERRRSLYGSAS